MIGPPASYPHPLCWWAGRWGSAPLQAVCTGMLRFGFCGLREAPVRCTDCATARCSPWPRVSTSLGVSLVGRWIRFGPAAGQIRNKQLGLLSLLIFVAHLLDPGWLLGSYTLPSSRPGTAAGVSLCIQRWGMPCLGTGAGGGQCWDWLSRPRLRHPVASGQPDPLVRLSGLWSAGVRLWIRGVRRQTAMVSGLCLALGGGGRPRLAATWRRLGPSHCHCRKLPASLSTARGPAGQGRVSGRSGLQPGGARPSAKSPGRLLEALVGARMVGHHTGPAGMSGSLQRIPPRWVGFPVAAVRCSDSKPAGLGFEHQLKRYADVLDQPAVAAMSAHRCWLLAGPADSSSRDGGPDPLSPVPQAASRTALQWLIKLRTMILGCGVAQASGRSPTIRRHHSGGQRCTHPPR